MDVEITPKKGDVALLTQWRPIPLVPTVCMGYEICVWQVLNTELRPVFHQLFELLKNASAWTLCRTRPEAVRKAEEWRKKLAVRYLHSAWAFGRLFDSVHPKVLRDCLLERGAFVFSAAAAVREDLYPRSRPMLNSCAFETVEIQHGT